MLTLKNITAAILWATVTQSLFITSPAMAAIGDAAFESEVDTLTNTKLS